MKSYNTKNQMLIKRFTTVFIIVAMVFTLLLPAAAAEDNIVSVSSIRFDDGNGNAVQSLDGLDKVRAQVDVQTKSSQKMVFVLALYGKNNKLLKIEKDSKRATNSGTTFEAVIEYNIPANAEGYKLNAFLVDSVKDMNAIARGSLFPSANLELANLFVTIDDNEPVDLVATQTPKDGVYKLNVPLDIKYAPSIKAVAADGGTLVEVTPPTVFPGSSEVKLTASNGDTKTYVVEYVAKSSIESLAGYSGKNFHAADDATEEYGSQYFHDRATPVVGNAGIAYYNDVRSISDEWDYLKGSDYYMAGVGDYTNPSYKADRSTTVHVFGTSAITDTGWTSSTKAAGHIVVSHTTGAGVEGHPDYKAAQPMTVVSSKTFPAGTVTLPAIHKSFVVVIEPAQYVPESHKAFAVASITANGEYVDTTEGPGTYDAPLSSDTLYAPEITEDDITFVSDYAGRTVEITNPTSFPGQSVIKITAAGESVEYVINYVADGLITNASSNLGYNFHAADDDNAVENAGYLRGSRFFMDRDDATLYYANNPAKGVGHFNDIRSISSEYDFLNGSHYFMTSAGSPVNTKFTVGRDADAYIFMQIDAAVTGANGWTKSANSGGYMTISSSAGEGVPPSACVEAAPLAAAKMTTLYHKKLAPGDSVNITPGTNKAIVVVKFRGYIEKGLTLTNLAVDGKPVAGFSADIHNYSVEIPANTLLCPKVTATAENADTEMEIIEPDTFPGKAIVRLTYEGKTRDYTITYTASELISNASRAVGKNFREAKGEEVGSQIFSDRACPAIAIGGGIAYYNDVRAISDEWKYLSGTDYFMSSVAASGRPVTFTLNRDAVVRVFSDGTAAMSTADGWKRAEKTDAYLVASTTTGNMTVENSTKFTQMFYKSFSAGDTVTVSPAVMTAITVIDYSGYIEGGAMLSEITVDGEKLAGFSMTKKEYTYEIDADTLIAPEVTATALIPGSEVEITNPTSFPGKVTIKVSYNGEESIYTVKYTTSDLISDASRAVGKDFHAADDANATEVNGAKIGSQLYNDRATPSFNSTTGEFAYFNDIRAIDDEWDYLNGTDFFTSAVGSRSVTFTLNRSATVRVFSEGTAAVSTADGWVREPKESGYYMVASATSGHLTVDNSSKFTQMFYKKFSAGETVTVNPTVKESIIVIDYMGYMERASALLSGIEVNGEALPGFSMDKTDYTMEIDPATVEVPVVTATALVDGSDVEVIDPVSFPGKTIVRVSLDGDEKEYTITYTVADLVASSSRAVSKDFHAADDANATESGGYKIGSPIFSDRGSPVTNAAGLAYFNDVRSISDEWDYLNGTDFFTTSVAAGGRSATFTLNRKATIRVFALETNALNTADGWTKESKSDGFMKVSFTSGHIDESSCGQFGYMFYRELPAGEEITVSPSTRDFLVVIDYAGYGEVEEVPADNAALTDITIDGVSIDGFDAEVTDYAYEIAPDALVIPEITATPVNSDSEVEIINPGMGDNPNVFPGKTIIIVRSGSDEREYVIDYTYTGLSAITDMSSSNGGSFFAVNFHEPGDFGETYGSRLFYDRTAVPAYSGSTLAYYNDVREICDEMDYLKGRDYIMANRNLGANVTHTFTLLRPATIRVFHLTGYAAGNATLADWTTVVNDTAYIRTSYTTGSGVEGHAAYRETLGYGSMTYKEFAAGDEVSVASPGDHAIVVIDYAGYEN